jgi:flagellar biogenesis protein FliO
VKSPRWSSRAVLLGLCLAGSVAAQTPVPPAVESSPPSVQADVNAPQSRPATQGPLVENRSIRRVGGYAGGSASDGAALSFHATGSWWMWLQTMGILGVVLAVMGLALKWLRKAGFGGSFGGSTAAVQVLSRGYLTNKHQMVLVRFGGRILLLGVGPQNLNLLSEVSEPAEVSEVLARLEGGKSGSISQEFQQSIDSAVQEYDRTGHVAGPMVEGSPDSTGASRVSPLRQELRSLLAKMQSLGRRPPE